MISRVLRNISPSPVMFNPNNLDHIIAYGQIRKGRQSPTLRFINDSGMDLLSMMEREIALHHYKELTGESLPRLDEVPFGFRMRGAQCGLLEGLAA